LFFDWEWAEAQLLTHEHVLALAANTPFNGVAKIAHDIADDLMKKHGLTESKFVMSFLKDLEYEASKPVDERYNCSSLSVEEIIAAFRTLVYQPEYGDDIFTPNPKRATDFILALRVAWARKAVSNIKKLCLLLKNLSLKRVGHILGYRIGLLTI